MKITTLDMRNIISSVTGIWFELGPWDDDENCIPPYLFDQKTQENIAHNFMVAEIQPLNFDGEPCDVSEMAYLNLPAWALTTRAQHKKEERTPKQHIEAILDICAFCGYKSHPDVVITDRAIATSAKAAHDLLMQAQKTFPSTLAGVHDKHSRAFCDDLARQILDVALVNWGVPGGILDRAMTIVGLYHNAWGF